MESQGIDKFGEEGGLKPQVSRKPRFTREIAAIAFTTTSFQIVRVKRREARRSPKKPKKWRKTVARSSPKGKSTVLDSSQCPRSRRFYRMVCSSNFPERYLAQNNFRVARPQSPPALILFHGFLSVGGWTISNSASPWW